MRAAKKLLEKGEPGKSRKTFRKAHSPAREGSRDVAVTIQEVAEEAKEPTLVALGRGGPGGPLGHCTLGRASADVFRAMSSPVLIATPSSKNETRWLPAKSRKE